MLMLNTKISKVKNKIPGTSGLVTTTVLDTKVGEVESKIPEVWLSQENRL